MKFNKILLAVAAVAACIATSAQAQIGFDTFAVSRTYVLAAPQNIGPASNLVTNGPIDKVKLSGTGKIDFLTVTNTGTTGGTLTATLYTSVDQTNLVALANYALITAPTTDSITNYYYGGPNLTCNNSVLLPGTVTSPTAWSAGFNTPYLAPSLFTNSGAITLTGNKTVQVGIRITDTPRYIYVVYTPGGSVTNFTAAALLTAQAGY
jgi:hypothetical protein